jgi:LuxR family transcriptional regulator, maltose regulon positive regulatory protein
MTIQASFAGSNSKLRAPRPAAFQVPRNAVWDRIRSSTAGVVLLQAPAGFGKTTTMLQLKEHLAAQSIPAAWLALDAADNDVGHFLGFLRAAFDKLFTSSADAASAAAGPLALDLIDRIADQESPFALFLDDFEVIDNPAVLALVKQFAESLPAQARLVIGSRNAPDIGLARLRARGQLLEIEPAELRFSVPETREFVLAQKGLRLQDGDISKLHRRTEGWPVALQLASVALERREEPGTFVEKFSGSNAMVADYLAEEVLARQPEELRSFLLRTSILRELSAPLCDAVCGRSDSSELLARLERANLFLIPVDEERRWFRYHALFSAFLRGQLERSFPAEIAELQRRASAWYEAQQRPTQAIDHALASGDLDLALPVVAANAARVLGEGRVRLLARWLDAIPPLRLRAYPHLRIIHAWALSFTRGPVVATALLDELESARAGDARLGASIDALRVNLLAMNDSPEEAHALGTERLAGVDAGSFSFRVMSNALAYTSMTLGKYAEARRMLDESRKVQGQGGGSMPLVYADLVEAVIDLVQGRLRQATTRCRVTSGAGRIGSQAGGEPLAMVLLAEMLYEADELEQAERLLGVYLPMMQELALPEPFIIGHRTLARIAAEHGDHLHAQQLMTEMEHLAHRKSLVRAVASAKLERARLSLLQGDVALAREELQRCREVVDWQRIAQWSTAASEVDTYQIGRLRWLIHSGAADEAVPKLKQDLERAELQSRERRALKLRILLALALDRSGQDRAGLRVLREALQQAAAEGFVRSFLDEGRPVQDLLQRYAQAQLARGDDAGQAATPREYLDRLLRADAGAASAADAAGPSPEASQYEALTDRELRTLRLLAEGLSNDDIAGRLFVSESTVRTHLRNINAKFGVRNRTQAIAVARRLKLVS